jgi:phosphoribosyl 1,2-cyclic phosphodiesterase
MSTATQQQIQQFLPQELREIAMEYQIPEKFLTEMPKIIQLILESKSMDTKEEKQSWFNLMSMMSAEQIVKLNDILTREKIKLTEIEKKYEEKKNNIKEKYIKRRESM